MELEFIDWLAKQTPLHPGVVQGIGDDAAVLQIEPGEQLVVTTDMLIAGTHFDPRLATAQQIGHKALAVNLSDLAAMAAKPLAAFVSLSLPSDNASHTAQGIAQGMQPLAEQHRCTLAGGDTNVVAGPLALSVTALGTVPAGQAWLRSGARPGDRLLVTGQLGGSLLGHHLEFEPRVQEALHLRANYRIHAALDISDGLSLDLQRMLQQSGVGAIVDVEHLPVSLAAVARAKSEGQKSPLEHALGDGEDFELLLAVPPDHARQLIDQHPLKCGLTDIGEITKSLGLHQRNATGPITPLPVTGYQH